MEGTNWASPSAVTLARPGRSVRYTGYANKVAFVPLLKVVLTPEPSNRALNRRPSALFPPPNEPALDLAEASASSSDLDHRSQGS